MRNLKECYNNKIELLIIGDIFGKENEYFNQKINEYNLHDTIRCTGWLPYEKVGDALSEADIGIILSESTMNNMLAGPPNKLFNYMRYGLPIISVNLPETSRIISNIGCGLILKDPQVNNIVYSLSSLIEDKDKRRKLGQNGEKAVYDQYNWSQMEKKLLRTYEELIPKHNKAEDYNE
jgi:glycosyltransferase involved in cell wall biosynthesis